MGGGTEPWFLPPSRRAAGEVLSGPEARQRAFWLPPSSVLNVSKDLPCMRYQCRAGETGNKTWENHPALLQASCTSRDLAWALSEEARSWGQRNWAGSWFMTCRRNCWQSYRDYLGYCWFLLVITVKAEEVLGSYICFWNMNPECSESQRGMRLLWILHLT